LYQQGDKARGIVACQSWHGASGAGDKLLAQHARYVGMTLAAYKTGKRTSDQTLDKVMRKSVKKLIDGDIKYLSGYIQSMVAAP
jgi:cytochrome c553